MRVAVIGGGIAGLSAAWELRGRAEATIFESSRVGGKILTQDFDGSPVDCGADSFITRDPAGLALCQELGLESELVSPSAGGVLLYRGGGLHRLPAGLLLGVPRRLLPLARSGVLSPWGVARAGLGLLIPRRPPIRDKSVREAVAGRFGSEVADRLVAPLVGSIHACPIDGLSAEATVPQLLTPRWRSSATGNGPGFVAPRKGMGVLVERLVLGAEIRDLRVESLVKDGPTWRVEPSGETFDAAVVATPARDAAGILDAPALRAIPTASVAVVTLGYTELDLPQGVSGVLADPDAGLVTTALSFASLKWPHLAGKGRSVLRVSVGRAGDERALHLDDCGLVERVAEETLRLLDIKTLPDTWRVNRWPDSFPIYEVGHVQRIRRIEDELRRTNPPVRLCGSSYRGAGVPACIRSGRTAASEILT